MKPRTLAQLLAAGRVGIGLTLLASPAVVTRHWVGEAEGDRLGTRVMAAGLGARDLVIGAGVLASLGSADGRRWLVASAASDLGDLIATLRSRGELPTASLAGTMIVAGGSALAGAWLAAQADL